MTDPVNNAKMLISEEISPAFNSINVTEYPHDYGQHPRYLNFLRKASELSKKEASKGAKLTKHHIIPTHFSKNKKTQTIELTYRYHAYAHLVLFLLHGIMWDFCAYRGLIGGDTEMRKLIQQAIVAKNRAKQTGFFSQVVQRELAMRPKSRYFLRDNPDKAKEFAHLGGIASGKIWTPAKIAAAQEKGKKLGPSGAARKGGIKGQNPETTQKIQKTIYWVHDN